MGDPIQIENAIPGITGGIVPPNPFDTYLSGSDLTVTRKGKSPYKQEATQSDLVAQEFLRFQKFLNDLVNNKSISQSEADSLFGAVYYGYQNGDLGVQEFAQINNSLRDDIAKGVNPGASVTNALSLADNYVRARGDIIKTQQEAAADRFTREAEARVKNQAYEQEARRQKAGAFVEGLSRKPDIGEVPSSNPITDEFLKGLEGNYSLKRYAQGQLSDLWEKSGMSAARQQWWEQVNTPPETFENREKSLTEQKAKWDAKTAAFRELYPTATFEGGEWGNPRAVAGDPYSQLLESAPLASAQAASSLANLEKEKAAYVKELEAGKTPDEYVKPEDPWSTALKSRKWYEELLKMPTSTRNRYTYRTAPAARWFGG